MAQIGIPTSPAARETRHDVTVSLALTETTGDISPQETQALLFKAMEQLGIDAKQMIDITAKQLTSAEACTKAIKKDIDSATPAMRPILQLMLSYLLTVASPPATEVKKKEDKKTEEKEAKDKKDPKDTDKPSQEIKNVKGKGVETAGVANASFASAHFKS